MTISFFFFIGFINFKWHFLTPSIINEESMYKLLLHVLSFPQFLLNLQNQLQSLCFSLSILLLLANKKIEDCLPQFVEEWKQYTLNSSVQKSWSISFWYRWTVQFEGIMKIALLVLNFHANTSNFILPEVTWSFDLDHKRESKLYW